MIEQMCIETASPESPSENWVYEILLPSLKNCLSRSNAGPDNLDTANVKDFSSVYFLKRDPYDSSIPPKKQLAFRICCRKGQSYFGISDSYLENVPPEFRAMATASKRKDGFTNLEFEPTQDGVERYADLLCAILDAVTYSLQKDFDCCSRFEQCSKAKQCVHPNPAMATGCGYRKILKSGRIYYGENRNIG